MPGLWQDRSSAPEVEPGVYEVRFTPPREGIYLVQFESSSLGLKINRSPSWSIEVEAPAKAASAL